MSGYWLPLISSGQRAPTGNVIMGLGGNFYFTNFYPFANVLKTASEAAITNSNSPGVSYNSAVPQGSVDASGNVSPYGAGLYLDNNGDFLSSLPAGTINYSRIIYTIPGGTTFQPGISGPVNFVGAGFTVDWTGGAAGWTVSVTSTSTPTLCSGTGTTPLTFTWPAATDQISIVVNGSGANPPTQIRVYKTTNQAALNADPSALDALYATQTASASWAVRLMDWQNTNWNITSTSISNFPTTLNAGWTGGGNGFGTFNNNTVGIPLDTMLSVSRQLNKNPWICIPEGFTTPKMRRTQSISNSSTPVVTTYGPHTFANSDTVIGSYYTPFAGYLLTNPTSYSASTFTVSGTAVLANDTPITFGINSGGTADGSTYPTGITKGAIYWTVNASSTTYQIATSPGGSALSLSGSMTGTINVAENYLGPRLTNPASVNVGTATFTVSGGHALPNGTAIVFGKLLDGSTDGSTYPTGIVKGTTYYIVTATGTTYQISDSSGGVAKTLTGSMIGTINVVQDNGLVIGAGLRTSGLYGQARIVTSYSASTWTLNGHGMANGTAIQFGVFPNVPLNTNADASTYPVGITKLLTYYVVNAGANTFQTALTPGGSAMSLSGSMDGQIHIFLTLAGNSFTVANANTSNNTFELSGPGANTSGYYGKAQIIPGVEAGAFLMPFNLATIDSVVGALVSYINAHKQANITPIYELANEIWNFQFSAIYTFKSQIPDPTQYQNSTSFINGYLMAAVAHAVRKSYGGHSGYKFVFSGNQTAADSLGGGAGVAAGALQYLTDHGGGLTITDLFDFLSVANYVGASYTGNGTPDTATFGTNTISFASAFLGMPVKLNVNSPGGTLPTGLTAGTLSGASYPSGSGQIYWLVGSAPNFGLATTPSGSPVSFTGGSGTNTATFAGQDVIQFLMAQSQSLHGSNPATYPNEWTYFDTAISEDVFNSKWVGGWPNISPVYIGFASIAYNVSRFNYYITNYTAVGKQLAGLPLICYEGGESNNPNSTFQMLNDATWRAAYTFQQYGAGSAANYMQMYTNAVQPGLITHMAQFVDVSVLFIAYGFGNFGAQQYVGDNNSRWLGVVAVNSLN